MKIIKPCEKCGGKLWVNDQCIRCAQRIELTAEQSAQFSRPVKLA